MTEMIEIEYESDASYDTDVSLDEEDEELIWRVFFSALDKTNNEENLDEEEEDSDDEENYDDNYDNDQNNQDEDEDDEDDDEEDLTDLSEIDDEELVEKYRNLKKTMVDKNLTEEEKKRLLIANFTEDQMERFEAYRRMTVNKPGVKKICNGVLGHSIPHNIAVVIAGISKSFLGEVITKAFEIQERENKARLILDIDAKKKQKREIVHSLQRGQDIEVDERRLVYEGDRIAPLQPHHIREAWRIYKLENSSVFSNPNKRQGDADGWYFR
ncbi:TAF11 [[Candida] subhashii]|uniref:TAF11 n=1 Tax=[Candida] subhashii TaxID=561895 RepID=A0A8J5QHE1_9ASCO|nr:TAF11 [[Candida] subhashii]KAG7661013.1 TAF11 [[Candida] subhashii]